MSNSLDEWDEMEGNDEPLIIPEPLPEGEEEVVVVVAKKEILQETKVNKPAVSAMEEVLLGLSDEHELIAQAMLMVRGDIAKASRLDSVDHNAMSLRAVVKSNPAIRVRYHELLADELQEKGLHVAERILRMAELQEKAMGCTVMVEGPDGMEEMEMPADPKMVIELSKEISRLIAEGKNQNMSAKAGVMIASKEDAKEILASFLNS